MQAFSVYMICIRVLVFACSLIMHQICIERHLLRYLYISLSQTNPSRLWSWGRRGGSGPRRIFLGCWWRRRIFGLFICRRGNTFFLFLFGFLLGILLGIPHGNHLSPFLTVGSSRNFVIVLFAATLAVPRSRPVLISPTPASTGARSRAWRFRPIPLLCLTTKLSKLLAEMPVNSMDKYISTSELNAGDVHRRNLGCQHRGKE